MCNCYELLELINLMRSGNQNTDNKCFALTLQVKLLEQRIKYLEMYIDKLIEVKK